MSNKNRKPPRTPPPAGPSANTGNPEPADAPNPLPERHEMALNGPEIGFSGLTTRQRAALPIVAQAPSLVHAARESGVSKSTLHRWMDEPDFSRELDRFNEQSADIARQQIKSQTRHALSVFADIMDGPDPALRLPAARYMVNFALRVQESETLASDLQDIKDAMDVRKT